ncbi:NAD(P)-binding protein [Linderina pennispora]|uniref:NAD(P)-binding protein n=1 Tax=Linderina pennispora TaxID=61395 RepID=A0A1Y1WJY2_9FUNG|nr:NAD(P)-binding protein [Linderina pennispora]ORX73847.1 NAD(P)-binding protein [Linderina pennispora]
MIDISALFSVKDRSFVITGGGSGLGRMMAEGLVSAGARVYITSRNEESLTADGPGTCSYIACNITDAKQVHALSQKVSDLEPNGLHALINNSGLFLPLLKRAATKERPTRIVNIASIAGHVAPNLAIPGYAASKAALVHMTKDMAQKFAEYNINVNSISPGLAELLKTIPMHKLGSPGDMAGTILFLSSDASAFLTGSDIVVDGGYIIKA